MQSGTTHHNAKQHNDIHSMMQLIGKQAKAAYMQLSNATTEQKNNALRYASEHLLDNQNTILEANANDVQEATKAGISGAMLDRLKLDKSRIKAMADGLNNIATLPDPVGKTLDEWQQSSGLKITRLSVPLGVIGIIYESRPNVTADAGALCLKSGNAAILRGGSDSLHSSHAIATSLHHGLREAGLPETAIQIVPTTDRAAVGEMLTMNGLIDVIIPRGGKSLTSRVQTESRVPTLLHLDGNCHSYVHQAADQEKAIAIILNAKMRRTGICGATESLLIDRAIAMEFLPKLMDALEKADCNAKGDDSSQAIDPRITPANETDWGTEYLDAVLSIKIVDGVDEAAAHINHYGSHHTDAIITQGDIAAEQFTKQVDSAIVMVNSSTQFADGGEFGMGAEIGIATGRLHARGPVGAAQLTTYKYIVRSDGQIRP